MAPPRVHDPVLLLCSVFGRHEPVLAWARARLEQAFGPVALAGPRYAFSQTAYYEPEMGPHLQKQLLAFERLVPADSLPEVKLQTNAIEREAAAAHACPEPRPLNLDPGVLTLGKVLLATTKDQAHRIYLRDGIFAEVTLRFEAGQFVAWPWTYADYRQDIILTFLAKARGFYRDRLAARDL